MNWVYCSMSPVLVTRYGLGRSPKLLVEQAKIIVVDAQPPLQSAMSDIREAVDWLAANKHARMVILLGLCSGADHSIQYASSDRRVVGVALLDPSVPRTKKFHLNEYRRRLTSLVNKSPAQALGSIANLLKRSLGLDKHIGTSSSEPVEPSLDDDELRGMFESHYHQCVLADVKMLALFTGGTPGNHNYREQLIDAFPAVAFGDRLTLEYVPQSDHAFTSESDRELLSQSVLRWLQTTSFTNAGRLDILDTGSDSPAAAEAARPACHRIPDTRST